MYEDRWEIELVMRYYKSACEFDETRVHSDYSVIGSELCDFLATVLTFRLIKAFDRAGLLEKMNYSRVMSLLRRAKKARVGEDGERRLIRVNPKLEAMLGTLGLAPAADVPPRRKPGRPPKLQKWPPLPFLSMILSVFALAPREGIWYHCVGLTARWRRSGGRRAIPS